MKKFIYTGFLIGLIFCLVIHLGCAFINWDKALIMNFNYWRMDFYIGIVGALLGLVTKLGE